MILVLTNADTEILALRSVVEGLPDGFPPVRAARPRRACPPLDGVDDGPRPAARRATGVGGAVRRAAPALPRRRHPAAGLRRRGHARRRADRRCRPRRRPPSPGPSSTWPTAAWPTPSTSCASWPATRHQPPVERARRSAVARRATPHDPTRPDRRRRLLPGPRPGREHAVRRRPVRGHRGPGRQRPAGVVLLAAARRRGGAVSTSCRDGRRRRHHRAGHGRRATATTGTRRRWPPSTCPSSRPSPPPSRSTAWEASTAGLTPIDVAMSVAIPEFDGRIIGVPFSFKEVVDDGDELGAPVTAYRTVPDRVARVAGLAVRLAALRHVPNDDKRLAVVLSAYPTKRSRIGNAVGLDTPASVIDLLHALRAAGYRVDRIPADGDALMAELADGCYDRAAAGPVDSPTAARRSTRFARRLPAPAVDEHVGRRRDGTTTAPRPSPASTWAACSSPSSRPAASARTPSPSTTRPTCPPPTTTSPSTAGWRRRGAPTPSSTSASTAPSSGCRARASASRRRAAPTPPSATCRSSTPSWSTTPARAPRPSAGPTP